MNRFAEIKFKTNKTLLVSVHLYNQQTGKTVYSNLSVFVFFKLEYSIKLIEFFRKQENDINNFKIRMSE